MSTMKGRLAKGALWIGASRALVNLLGLASTLLLARLLSPADFGLVAIGTTIAAIVTSVTELSLASALIQHRDPTAAHYDGAWTLNLLRAGILALIIAAIAVPVAHFYGDARLVPILLVIAGTTFAGGAANPKLVMFSRNLIFWQEFAISVSQKMVGLAAAATLAILYRSYWALIAGAIVPQIWAVILSFILIPYRPRLRLSGVRELLSFSIWLTLGQAINTLNWKFDQLVIGYFLGNTPLGYYTFGDNLAVLPTREATTPIAQTLFPGFSRLTHDPARLAQVYQRAQSFLCAVALPVGFGFAVIAKPLLLLAVGAKWLPALTIIQFLAGIFALQTLSSSLQPLAMAMGQTRSLFYRDMLNFAIRIPLIVIGMFLGGLAGIVYARCVSGLLSTAINMEMARRLLGLGLLNQLAVNARSLMAVSVMVTVSSLVLAAMGAGDGKLFLAEEIAVAVLFGAVTYISVLFLLWNQANRPESTETELLALLGKMRGAFVESRWGGPNA